MATESAWLSGFPESDPESCHHYVVVGRDGYVELIAERFKWRKWLWTAGHRDDMEGLGSVVATGEGK